MATSFQIKCRFFAVSAGAGNFVVASAYASGFDIPQNLGAIDAKLYHYYAESDDSTVWEDGFGTWRSATGTLERTTVRANSNNTTTAVTFASPPNVSVFPAALALEPAAFPGAFPSGTVMLFFQNVAPTTWTRFTGFGDRLLRINDGTLTAGGSTAFSTWSAQTVVGNTTISIGTMPSHTHQDDEVVQNLNLGFTGTCFAQNIIAASPGAQTGAQGGGGAHNHTVNFSVAYVDLMMAQKN